MRASVSVLERLFLIVAPPVLVLCGLARFAAGQDFTSGRDPSGAAVDGDGSAVPAVEEIERLGTALTNKIASGRSVPVEQADRLLSLQIRLALSHLERRLPARSVRVLLDLGARRRAAPAVHLPLDPPPRFRPLAERLPDLYRQLRRCPAAAGLAAATVDDWLRPVEFGTGHCEQALACYSYRSDHVAIQFSRSAKDDGMRERLLTALLWECFNVLDASAGARLDSAAYDGRLDRDEYLTASVALDRIAHGNLQRFLLVHRDELSRGGMDVPIQLWKHRYAYREPTPGPLHRRVGYPYNSFGVRFDIERSAGALDARQSVQAVLLLLRLEANEKKLPWITKQVSVLRPELERRMPDAVLLAACDALPEKVRTALATWNWPFLARRLRNAVRPAWPTAAAAFTVAAGLD